MIEFFDVSNDPFYPLHNEDVYGILVRGNTKIDFIKYPNLNKLTFVECFTMDLHDIPKDRNYEMIEFDRCFIHGEYSHGAMFRKVFRLYLTNTFIIDPLTFHMYFEDVGISVWKDSTFAMPVTTRCIIVRDFQFIPKQLPELLQVYKKCECINFRLEKDEDATDMLRIYEEYEQLSPVIGMPSFFMDFATDLNVAWRFQLNFKKLDRPLYTNINFNKFNYINKLMYRGVPLTVHIIETNECETFNDWLDNYPWILVRI